jgi:hypothetical protein
LNSVSRTGAARVERDTSNGEHAAGHGNAHDHTDRVDAKLVS